MWSKALIGPIQRIDRAAFADDDPLADGGAAPDIVPTVARRGHPARARKRQKACQRGDCGMLYQSAFKFESDRFVSVPSRGEVRDLIRSARNVPQS
jgi:hypothetical protein